MSFRYFVLKDVRFAVRFYISLQPIQKQAFNCIIADNINCFIRWNDPQDHLKPRCNKNIFLSLILGSIFLSNQMAPYTHAYIGGFFLLKKIIKKVRGHAPNPSNEIDYTTGCINPRFHSKDHATSNKSHFHFNHP